MAVTACLSSDGFAVFGEQQLLGPRLLWSESCSVLHELKWRKQISTELASVALQRLMAMPVHHREPGALRKQSWRIADELGWAKTYDAEYVALAQLLRCRLVTTDARLKRTASKVVEVVGPTEL